jgi:hypothetical protein
MGIYLVSRRGSPRAGGPGLEFHDAGLERREFILLRLAGLRVELRVEQPPVHADFPGLVHRGDYQADLDGQEFDVYQFDLDVAGS